MKSYVVTFKEDRLAYEHFKSLYGYREDQTLNKDDKTIEIARMDAFIEGNKFKEKEIESLKEQNKIMREALIKIRECAFAVFGDDSYYVEKSNEALAKCDQL